VSWSAPHGQWNQAAPLPGEKSAPRIRWCAQHDEQLVSWGDYLGARQRLLDAEYRRPF